MPKIKKEKLNVTEKNLLGEVEKVHLPRNEKGRFVSTKVTQEGNKPRSIRLVKVKGSYGSFVTKEKLIPDELRKTLLGIVIIGLLIAVF